MTQRAPTEGDLECIRTLLEQNQELLKRNGELLARIDALLRQSDAGPQPPRDCNDDEDLEFRMGL